MEAELAAKPARKPRTRKQASQPDPVESTESE